MQETNGAATKLTGMRIDGTDYSNNLPTWFGDGGIAANGSIDATIHASGLVSPVNKFFGKDAASGQLGTAR